MFFICSRKASILQAVAEEDHDELAVLKIPILCAVELSYRNFFHNR